MLDSQNLMKEQAENGVEKTFRELVERYVNLVYGTALRLVNGDTQLAEDVSQTVFITLARKVDSLPPEVMLGGWLHRCTFHAATKAVRSEQRRQVRERQAAEMMEMNTSPHDAEETARQIKPVLDAALLQLNQPDRHAILLRFFEERSFYDIGAALNLSEDAARMRVTRALEKLHALLTKRGAVIPVAGLAAVLAVETGKAAPAGLALKLAGGALTAGGGGILQATLFHFMNATKLKAGMAAVILLTGMVTSIVVQQRVVARVRAMDAAISAQTGRQAKVAADNERLHQVLAAEAKARTDLADLERLRATAAALRQKTNELTTLREQNQALRQQLQSLAQTPLQKKEEAVKRLNFVKKSVLAGILYAEKNGHYPASLDEAAPFFPADRDSSDIDPENFELLYHGPPASLTNFQDTIVLREKDPWLGSNGRWVKTYGFADGHAQSVTIPSTWNGVTYNDFDAYEQAHTMSEPAQ